MKLRARVAMINVALAMAAAAIATPLHAAEYTLKWATVTRGDMQEKFTGATSNSTPGARSYELKKPAGRAACSRSATSRPARCR